MWSTEARANKDMTMMKKNEKQKGKLSCAMAMILGIFVTLEIMVAGAMVFNLGAHGADAIAVVFAFVVLYSGVVAVLTDK